MDSTKNTKQSATKPIQLISFDEDKKLILSPQAVDIFKKMESQQLHIVTVAGKYRTGKSYILNRVLLGKNSGFQVGPTINACTKGLWMWPEVVKIQSANGTKDCIIVDTEGLGSLQQGENTDIKIFLMAILLSSYLIYNSVGSIDEKAIQNLSLVINLAEMLHRDNNQYDSQQLINSFPSFMWLVRDFSLRLEDQNGQPMTSTQYLQSALRYQQSSSQAAQRKNMIRKKLKTFFQDRNCFTLVRPTQNQKDLQNLSKLNERLLRPQFVRLIKDFKQTIHANLKPKKVRGKTVTPQGFIQLCKYFVNTINEGKLPSINSHWDNLCVKQSTRIIQQYSKTHKERLQKLIKSLNEGEDKLKVIKLNHQQILKQAEQKINKSFLGKLQKQLSKERLAKVLDDIYKDVIKEINDEKFALAKQIVNKIFVEILQEFGKNKLSSFQQIFARFEEIKEKYKHDEGIYQSFYQNSKDVFQQFVKNLKNQWEKEHMVLSEKNLFLQAIIQEKTQQVKEKLNQYSLQLREAEQKKYKIQLQYSQLSSENEILKKQCERLGSQNNKLKQIVEQNEKEREENLQKQLYEVKENSKKEINMLQKENTKLAIDKVMIEQQLKDIQIKERKTQREMEIFKNKCSQYLKQNFILNETIEKMRKKQMGLDKDKRKKGMEWKGNTPQVIKDLNCKIDELQIKLAMKEQENKNLAKTVNNQKLANQTLLKAPHNMNYAMMKKNYETEMENNKKIMNKLKDYELIHSMYCFKCQICQSNIDKNSLKSHIKLCTSLKDFNVDVSYQYNGKGQLQFVIDIEIDGNQWTVRKSIQNIKHYLKKMNVQSDLFDDVDPLSQDINSTEECRVFLDDIFNQAKEEIWTNSFLVEFFSADIHFLNAKRSIAGGIENSLKNSGLSLDLDCVLQENVNAVSNNMLMKTTKFSKKCFNFGPTML